MVSPFLNYTDFDARNSQALCDSSGASINLNCHRLRNIAPSRPLCMRSIPDSTIKDSEIMKQSSRHAGHYRYPYEIASLSQDFEPVPSVKIAHF
jgi:hypothetical protein